MSVNEKIKLVRQAKGLTQEEIAGELGMSVTTYGDIERGDKDPKLSKLQEIADVLGLSISELLDLTDKTVLSINLNRKDKGKNKYNVYLSSDSELEKQRLLVELKDKELAIKDREIALQQREIDSLKEALAIYKNNK